MCTWPGPVPAMQDIPPTCCCIPSTGDLSVPGGNNCTGRLPYAPDHNLLNRYGSLGQGLILLISNIPTEAQLSVISSSQSMNTQTECCGLPPSKPWFPFSLSEAQKEKPK